MSSFSALVIKGDFLKIMPSFENHFGFQDLNKDRNYENYNDFENQLFQSHLQNSKGGESYSRGFWVENNWTIIYDPELIDFLNEEALINLSQNLETEIWTFMFQTTSSSYGFAKYKNEKLRYFFFSDNEIIDDYGDSTEEEKNIIIDETINHDTLLSIAKNAQINLIPKSNSINFIIKEYGVEQGFKELENPNIKNQNKPWWKFW